MRLQRSGAIWAPSDIDAQRLTDQLRASRLTVLCGGPGAPTAQVLRAGVLPRVQRRSGDRRADRHAVPKALPFEDRRHGTVGSDAEVGLPFDDWTPSARTALKTRLQQALRSHPSAQAGALPQRLDELLIALGKRHHVRFLMVFDRFEDCLLASPDAVDLRALREEIFSAINRPQVPAHFLLTLREDTQPLLDRLRGRIRGFEAVRKPFPLDGAQGIGPWTMSWVPPVLAPASGRPRQTRAVYASIEALLGEMAQRSPGHGPPPLSAEDAAQLEAEAPEAAAPPQREALSFFGPFGFAAYGLSDDEPLADPVAPLAEDEAWAAFDAPPAADRAPAAAPVAGMPGERGAPSPATEGVPEPAAGPDDPDAQEPPSPDVASEGPIDSAALGTPFDAQSLSRFMSDLDDVLAASASPADPPTMSALATVSVPDLARWPDAAPLAQGVPPVVVSAADRAREAAGLESAADAAAPWPTDDVPQDPLPDSASAAADSSDADATPRTESAPPDDAGRPGGVAALDHPRSLRAPAAGEDDAPPEPRRAGWSMTASAAWMAIAALTLGLGAWSVLAPDRAASPRAAAGDLGTPATPLPSDTAPSAAGLTAAALAPLVELSAAGPLARSLADELAHTLPPGAGPTLLVRATAGWADDLGALHHPGRLAIVRQDALQAARADVALGPLQIVLPLFTEELVFVVRADSPLRYIHQIDGRRLSVGDPQSARALSVRAAYQQLFGRPLPVDRADASDEPTALRQLLEGSVDVVALIGTVPGAWPVAPALSDAAQMRLLRLDRGHPASQRALRWLVPAQLAAGVDGLPTPQPTPTLAVRSFLVAGASPGSEASANDLGGLARALCKQLPTLQREGHAKWREVQIGPMPQAGWPYAPEAAFALQDCVGRAPSPGRVGRVAGAGVGAPAAAAAPAAEASDAPPAQQTSDAAASTQP